MAQTMVNHAPPKPSGAQNNDEPGGLETLFPSLEQEAAAIAASTRSSRRTGFPSDAMGWEIAAALVHLEGVRAEHNKVRQDLLQSECAVRSELMQMEDRTPRYSPYRFPEREKLQRHLRRIEQERRQLAPVEGERIRHLRDLLLSLVLRHRELNL